MSIAEDLLIIAENVPKVHQAGYDQGYSLGHGDGYKKCEDDFWSKLQKNGSLTAYEYLFAGSSWHPAIFKPKFDINPLTSQYMFFHFGDGYDVKMDLTDVLTKQGVSLNTGKSSNFQSFARGAHISRFPVLDTRSAKSLQYMFAESDVKTIDGLILKDNGTQTFDSVFFKAEKLENITISGVIGNNIGFANCPLLTQESIISIVSALSTSATGRLIKFPSDTIYRHFSDDGINLNNDWLRLIEDKGNWDIQLV